MTRALRYTCLMLCFFAISCGRKETTDNFGTSPDVTGVQSAIPEGISWASMLWDASDLTALASPPGQYARSRQFTSSADTNKVVLAHLSLEVLGDLDHGFFAKVEDREGHVEATLAEVEGSGAITWMWSANPVGDVLLYIDDREKPALHTTFAGLLLGTFLPEPGPFAGVTANGYNLHFPIIHKEYCKVVLWTRERKDLARLFYQIAWDSIDSSKNIHPFDVGEIRTSKELVRSLAGRFGNTTELPTRLKRRDVATSLPPGREAVFFESDKGGGIYQIDIWAGTKSELSSLAFKAYWDKQTSPAVDCPLSMLAGVSAACEDTKSFPVTLEGTGITVRWYMPFSAEARLAVLNTGDGDCSVETTVWHDETTIARDKLRFHGNYHRHESLPLNSRNIVKAGEIYGAGRIVGCSLRVDSRSDKWWGEGDHIIWLDDFDEPAWRGTGTEDYFGFAWCSDRIFHHPFRGQTRADGSRTKRRIASMHRYHLLDTLPFHLRAAFEMEAWGLSDGFMDYEISLFWYSSGSAFSGSDFK